MHLNAIVQTKVLPNPSILQASVDPLFVQVAEALMICFDDERTIFKIVPPLGDCVKNGQKFSLICRQSLVARAEGDLVRKAIGRNS